jgi:hypothetical protein
VRQGVGPGVDGGRLTLAGHAGAGCGTAAVLTQPAAAARIARYDGVVEFVDEVVAVRCE